MDTCFLGASAANCCDGSLDVTRNVSLAVYQPSLSPVSFPIIISDSLFSLYLSSDYYRVACHSTSISPIFIRVLLFYPPCNKDLKHLHLPLHKIPRKVNCNRRRPTSSNNTAHHPRRYLPVHTRPPCLVLTAPSHPAVTSRSWPLRVRRRVRR